MVLADDLADLTVVLLANTEITVEGNIVRAEAGAVWDDVVVTVAGARARRAGVPVGHPRIGRRDAGAERRRVRRRGRRHHPPRPAARPPHRRGPLGCAAMPSNSVTAQAFSSIRPPRSCSRWSSRWTPTGAARRCATANWPPRWAPSRARAPTRLGCGRRCCRCGPGKGMVLDETDHDTWSVGSFFTNPVVTPRRVRAAAGRGRRAGAQLPRPGRGEAGRGVAGGAGRLRQGLSRRRCARTAVHQACAGADQPRRRHRPRT